MTFLVTVVIFATIMSSSAESAASTIKDFTKDNKKVVHSKEEGSSRSIYPFISCQHCDTFLQCFMRCPFAEYPGLNRYYNVNQKKGLIKYNQRLLC